jgi:hypothetical protein
LKKLPVILAGILVLSTIFILSGCRSNNSTSNLPQLDQNSSYVTVTNPAGNISISVPSDWNTNYRSFFPGSIIGVGDVANREFVIVTGEAKTRLGANSSAKDYLAQIKTDFTTIFPDGVWENSSNVTIGGLKGLAAQVTGTNRSSNTETTCFVYALATNDYYFNIVGVTNTSLVNANKATLQNIMNSFKVPVAVGAMFIVFGVWALEGFSYPSSPVPFVLNAVSKILSFTTIIALFSIGSKQIENKITLVSRFPFASGMGDGDIMMQFNPKGQSYHPARLTSPRS